MRIHNSKQTYLDLSLSRDLGALFGVVGWSITFMMSVVVECREDNVLYLQSMCERHADASSFGVAESSRSKFSSLVPTTSTLS